jgi:hypothetical protein
MISCSLNTDFEVPRKTDDVTRQNIQILASESSSGIQVVLAWVPVTGGSESYTVFVYTGEGQDRKYVTSLTTNKSMIVIENMNDGVYYYKILTNNGKEIGICGPITIHRDKIVNEDKEVEEDPEFEAKLEFDRETFEKERSLWEAQSNAGVSVTKFQDKFLS